MVRVLSCLSVWVGSSCNASPPSPPSDPELRLELGIPDEIPIHRIDVGDSGGGTRVLPRVTEIQPGHMVQFVTLDHRVHLIRFDPAELDPIRLAFLRDTSQDSPPPLVAEGSRLLLSFEGAPPGSYPFFVDGDGTPVAGEIRVVDRQR
jgi:hypothetical protein